MTSNHLDRKLKTKELDLYGKLPIHMIGAPTFDDIAGLDPHLIYSQLVIRLDHLLNLFLVERLLVKNGHSRGDLLRTSFEMVVLTMHFWTNKHRWAESQRECHWLVSLPSQYLMICPRSSQGAIFIILCLTGLR
jgi:hypothetical protein